MFVKIATGINPPWEVAAARPLADCTSETIRRLLDGVVPERSPAGAVVVAVPDHWTATTVEDRLREPQSSVLGRELLGRLRSGRYFTEIRLASMLACVAASRESDVGELLVCDVGHSAVTAAVCVRGGGTLRISDLEYAEIGRYEPVSVLLGAADHAGPTQLTDRTRVLHLERQTRRCWAEALLERAERQPRYRKAIVYRRSAHDGPFDVDAVRSALEPLAELAAGVVHRLLNRVFTGLSPALIMTGGNAVGPVVSAVARIATGRTGTLELVEPWAAAVGAQRLAAGTVRIVASDPPEVGLSTHRIHNGRLESLVVPVPSAESPPLEIEVGRAQRLDGSIHIRFDDGPWTPWQPNADLELPVGRYQVSLILNRAVDGIMSFRHNDTGTRHDFRVGPIARR